MSDWIDELAVETFNEHALAGLALGVVRGGRLDHFVGLGLADAEHSRPVDSRTVFRIGSISKTMTAIAVMQLVEEGRLALDDPVNDHLRSVRVEPGDPAVPVTVRHLLTHTAGIGELRRWADLAKPTIGLAISRDKPLVGLADYYAPALKAEVRAGTKWAYANHGFAMLGLLIADLREQPFAAVMRERLFDPLGMQHTSFDREPRVAERLAVGYHLRRARLKRVKDLEIAVGPAGACFSDVEDMVRYVAALAGGGAPLLERASLEAMLEPQGEPDPAMPSMGLSFFLDRVGEHRRAGHDGGWAGFVSAMTFAPDANLGVVALTNTTAAFAPHELAHKVLERLLGVEDHAPPLVAGRPHEWPALTGLYKVPRGLNTNLRWWPLIGAEVEIAVRKGHLVARAPSPVKQLRRGIRLHPVADDGLRFEARHGEWRVPVAFERGAGGAGGGDAVAVRAGSPRGGLLRLERRPKAMSVRLWGRAALGAGTIGAAATAARWRRR